MILWNVPNRQFLKIIPQLVKSLLHLTNEVYEVKHEIYPVESSTKTIYVKKGLANYQSVKTFSNLGCKSGL